jgi:hypothetical protein
MSIPWAYCGTDDAIPNNQYPISVNNLWPAIAVWLSLTANLAMWDDTPPFDSQKLADAIGITKASVDEIRSLAKKHETAFKEVAATFQKIGVNNGNRNSPPQDYPSGQCLTLEALVEKVGFVKNILPTNPCNGAEK